MAGNRQVQAAMQQETPRTYTALSHLVVALAKAVKSAGKKTWFGNDKSVKAYSALMQRINELVIALTLDGLVRPSMESHEVVDQIVAMLDFFAKAHPNWIDSYGLAYHIFVVEREDAIATIERMR